MRERIENLVKRFFDAYELYFLKEREKRFESKDGELYHLEFKEEEGLAIRGIKDERLFFYYTFEEPSEEMIKDLEAVLPFLTKDEDYVFPSSFREYPSLELFDEEGLKIPDQKKAKIVTEMEREILSFDRRIVKTRGCELREKFLEVEILNSLGLHGRARKTLYTISALTVAKDRDEVSYFDYLFSFFLKDLDFKSFSRKISEKTLSLLNGGRLKTGIYKGIIRPKAMTELLHILSFSFLSENLYKGKTKLREKRGKRCFSPILNILDSGLKGIDAFPFDGEGVPSRENIVVKEGIFVDFLYDAYYGKKYGRTSTGNGVRSNLKELPKCGVRGLYIEAKKEEINSILEDGIIIEEVMGTHTANPVTGDFSLGAVGFSVRGRELIPFKGVIFAGNLFELLGNILEIGNDLKFYGIFGSPSILFSNLKISGN